MNRRVPLSIIIFIIVIIPLLPWPSAVGGGDYYRDVGIGRREPIPGNLPWYPVMVFGDNRPDRSGEVRFNGVTYKLRDMLAEIDPFAVIGTGDHVWNGYVEQINHFIDTFSSVPNVWVVAGNHEWNNLPYVSDKNRDGVNYWRSRVAPDLYYKDDVPGWRIVFINLRAGYTDWSSVDRWLEDEAFKTSRHLIVVFHEPVYPRREASKAISSVHDKLIPVLDRYKPSIVLQGHVHCYYDGVKDGTLYIITGGGGAPKCKRYPYHFVSLILKPDGEYSYTPIAVSNSASGEPLISSIKITRQNETNSTHIVLKYIVYNRVKDIHGKPVSIPVRIKYRLGGMDYGIVYNAPPGTTTLAITYSINDHVLSVVINPSTHRASYPPYMYDDGGKVWVMANYRLTVSTAPNKSHTIGHTTTGSESGTQQATTATPASSTNEETGTASSTALSINGGNNSGETNNGSGYGFDETLVVIAAGLTIIISVEAYVLLRRKKLG